MKLFRFFAIGCFFISFFALACTKSSGNVADEDILIDTNPVNVPANYTGKWKLFLRASVPQIPHVKPEVLQADKLGFSQTIELKSDGTFTKEITGEDTHTATGTYTIVKGQNNITRINLEYASGTAYTMRQTCGNEEPLFFNKDDMMISSFWPACDGPYTYAYLKE